MHLIAKIAAHKVIATVAAVVVIGGGAAGGVVLNGGNNGNTCDGVQISGKGCALWVKCRAVG